MRKVYSLQINEMKIICIDLLYLSLSKKRTRSSTYASITNREVKRILDKFLFSGFHGPRTKSRSVESVNKKARKKEANNPPL